MEYSQGMVVDALSSLDKQNLELLDGVITAANQAADGEALGDVVGGGVSDGDSTTTHEAGMIRWGGKEASISGTGGVALLEFAKDAIQTAVSNVSGIGTNQIKMTKLAMNNFKS